MRSLLGTGAATRARCGNDVTATEPFAPGADGAALRLLHGAGAATRARGGDDVTATEPFAPGAKALAVKETS